MVEVILFDDVSHREAVIALWEAVFGYADARNSSSLAIAKKLGYVAEPRISMGKCLPENFGPAE